MSAEKKFIKYSEVALTTPDDEILQKVERVKKGYRSKKTLPISYRMEQLRNLYYGLKDNSDVLKEALQKDLHRHPNETEALEMHGVYAEIDLALNKLPKWAKEDGSGWGGLKFIASNTKVAKIPRGTVLLISPWNYPFFVGLVPIVNAIAAGNTMVWKPTEVITHTTQALTKLIENYMDPDLIQVVNGEIPQTTLLLEQKFDKILVTGSGRVGRVVAQAAAKHITPVVLELGGKSPALIAKDADIVSTAKRLVWGKFVNAGQTCVAPDYLLVESSIKDRLVEEMKKTIQEFYPHLSKDDGQFAHIPNERLFDRLAGLISETQGKIVFGGDSDKESLYIGPTVVTNVTAQDPLMQDELFGPILPIVTVEDISTEGVDFVIDNHDTPLALYIFTKNKGVANSILDRTRSGGAIVNDTILHVGMNNVPFGGIGEAGYGAYHGKDGFEAFSHRRTVVRQPLWAESLLKVRYPPYTNSKAKQLNLLSSPSEWYPRTGPVSKPLWRRLF